MAETIKKDMVNHPSHYTEFNTEVIDTIIDWIKFIKDPRVAYLIGTALKYIPRAYLKHEDPTEDFEKSVFYINKAVEVLKSNKEDKVKGEAKNAKERSLQSEWDELTSSLAFLGLTEEELVKFFKANSPF